VRLGDTVRELIPSQRDTNCRLFAAARFIGRVGNGRQIIVFGAAGTAMSASRSRRRAAVWAVAMAPPAGDRLWAPAGAGAAAQHHRPSEPPEGSR
jgi:hypothetical protein